LDEIGSLALESQAKLLRVLQEREFERVGGTRVIPIDVRVIAATNKDLALSVENGTFREDLFYRLNVYPIYLPPLRDREADVLLLADYFLEKASVTSGKKILRISKETMDIMMGYPWPGNIRELKNAIERSIVMMEAGEEVIVPSHIPLYIKGLPDRLISRLPQESASLDDAVSKFEKELIIEALHKTNGIQSHAAKLLGITERSIWHRLKKYGLQTGGMKDLQKM